MNQKIHNAFPWSPVKETKPKVAGHRIIFISLLNKSSLPFLLKSQGLESSSLLHWTAFSPFLSPLLELPNASVLIIMIMTVFFFFFLRRVRRLEKEQYPSGRDIFWLFPCHSSGRRFFRIILALCARILTLTHKFSGSSIYPSSSRAVHGKQSYRAAGVSGELSLALRWTRHRIADLSFLFCTLSWQLGLMKS